MNLDIEKIIREYIDKSIHLSLPSRRHSQEIISNPNVSGSIVGPHTFADYPHGIFFEGQASVMDSPEERLRILPAFHARLGASKSILEEALRPDGHQFYKIVVENWYAFGKFGRDEGKKYKLEWSGGHNG